MSVIETLHSVSDVRGKGTQIHLIMAIFQSPHVNANGQFEEWDIETVGKSLDRPWKLSWSRTISQRELGVAFPGYIQRHANGGSWEPSSVGYYVLE